jgi:transcriptional regulator of acetoin/glycerol metabolism
VVRDARPSRRIDRVDLVRALDTSAGNVAEAARALGTSKQTLYKLIARHSIALAGARMRARPPD